ncbi:UNKNOWN [Stylonychia lemnae]|uniref:EF-hand domain-containing protein n=1 Tax=Stylonychia lemnae TaxID=5949 RepID=A0A078B2N3_STYLE|nr:UNKNOWN [Stylonychia lemnae]|eukprot:CDW88739.1 UNKNOWN [Stylonychia lemnae]
MSKTTTQNFDLSEFATKHQRHYSGNKTTLKRIIKDMNGLAIKKTDISNNDQTAKEIQNTMIQTQRIKDHLSNRSKQTRLNRSISMNNFSHRVRSEYKQLQDYEENTIQTTSLKTFRPKKEDFTMIEQRGILQDIKGYNHIHQIIITVNYEFINEIVNDHELNLIDIQIEQSIDIFSKISFLGELMSNKDKQIEIMVQQYAQLRQNIRNIMRIKGANVKIIETLVDINSIFNNMMFFMDRIITTKDQSIKHKQEDAEDRVTRMQQYLEKKLQKQRTKFEKYQESQIEQQYEYKQQIKELQNKINALELEIGTRSDEMKKFKSLKLGNEMQDLEDLSNNLDVFLDAQQTSKQLFVQGLANLSKLMDFKTLKQDKDARIQNASTQTGEINEQNMTISIKLQNELRFLKPLTKQIEVKLLLDTYSSLNKTSDKLDKEIDSQVLFMMQQKYLSDVQQGRRKSIVIIFTPKFNSLFSVCSTRARHLLTNMIFKKQSGILAENEISEIQLWDYKGYKRILQKAKDYLQDALYPDKNDINMAIENSSEAQQLFGQPIRKQITTVIHLGQPTAQSNEMAKKQKLQKQKIQSIITAQQLFQELAKLIISVVVKDQELIFFKKLKQVFEENDLNKQGYIYVEQIGDILKRLMGELLSPFLLTILTQYVIQNIQDIEIQLSSIDALFRNNLGNKVTFSQDLLLRIMFCRIQSLIKNETLIIFDKLDQIYGDSEMDKMKSQTINFNSFKEVYSKLISQLHHAQASQNISIMKVEDEMQLIEIFQEINVVKDKLLFVQSKREFVSAVSQIISKFHPLINNNANISKQHHTHSNPAQTQSKYLDAQMKAIKSNQVPTKQGSSMSGIIGSLNISSKASIKNHSASQPMTDNLSRRQSNLKAQINQSDNYYQIRQHSMSGHEIEQVNPGATQKYSPHFNKNNSKMKVKQRLEQIMQQNQSMQLNQSVIENSNFDSNYHSVPDKKFYRFPKIEKDQQKGTNRKANMNQSADMKSQIQQQQQQINSKSYDNRYKQSKSALGQYEKFTSKGIAFLSPFNQKQGQNDTRNVVEQRNSQNVRGSVEKQINYEIPNLKFGDKNFTFDKDAEVFYSINQTHNQDFINANLKIIPNMIVMDPDRPLNFIKKKKHKSSKQNQLKSMMDQSQSPIALTKLQQSTFLNTDHNSVHEQNDQTHSEMPSTQLLSNKHKNELSQNLQRQILQDLTAVPSQTQMGYGSTINYSTNLNQQQTQQQGFQVFLHKRDFIKIQEFLDESEMELKNRKPSQDFQSHVWSIQNSLKIYTDAIEILLSKVSNKYYQKEKELIDRIKQGFENSFRNMQKLFQTQMKLNNSTIDELNTQIQSLTSNFEKYRETQSIEAYFLKTMENGDPNDQRKKFVQQIDDFLRQDPLSKEWDEDQTERDIAFDRSRFSGVSQALQKIKKSMKGHKDAAKFLEFMGLNEDDDDENNLEEREKVVSEIESSINNQIKNVQNTTAKKILARFLKQTQTQHAGCQAWTMEELNYNQTHELEELTIKYDNLRHERIQLVIQVDQLQDQINNITDQKKLMEKQLRQQYDVMYVENSAIKGEKQKFLDEIEGQKKEIMIFKKKIDELEKEVREKEELESRLNSIRNKYEEYDRVHNDSEREYKLDKTGSMKHADDQDLPSLGNNSKSMSIKSRFIGVMQVNQKKQTSVNESRGPLSKADQQSIEPSSRKNQFSELDRSKIGQAMNRQLSQYSNSQLQSLRDNVGTLGENKKSPRQSDQDNSAGFSGLQDFKSQLNKDISEIQRQDSQFKHLKQNSAGVNYLNNGYLTSKNQTNAPDAQSSLPISMQSSPRDMKITVQQQNQKVNQNDVIAQKNQSKFAPHINLTNQKVNNINLDSNAPQTTNQANTESQQNLKNLKSPAKNQNNQQSMYKDPQSKSREVIKNISSDKDIKLSSKKEIKSNYSHQQQENQEIKMKNQENSNPYLDLQNNIGQQQNLLNPKNIVPGGLKQMDRNLKMMQKLQNNSQQRHQQNDQKRTAHFQEYTSTLEIDDGRNANYNGYQNDQESSITTDMEAKYMNNLNDGKSNNSLMKYFNLKDQNGQTIQYPNQQYPSIKSQISVSHKKLVSTTSLGLQTENETFMSQIIEMVKQQIIQQLEQEKYKYTDKEYEILVKKAVELVQKIKSKMGTGGDVFFRAGQFLAQSSKPITSELDNANKSLLYDDKTSSLSPERWRVEEHFKVKLQKRAGGAGDFSKYGDKKSLKEPNQVLYSTQLQRQF